MSDGQILFAHSIARGHELVDLPITESWILSGRPRARCKGLTETDGAGSSSALWDCTAGRFLWRYGVDETVHILEGEVHVTCPTGQRITLRAGDVATFPAGITVEWDVPEYVLKLAFFGGLRGTRGAGRARLRGVARRIPLARPAVRLLRRMRLWSFGVVPLAAGVYVAQDRLLAL